MVADAASFVARARALLRAGGRDEVAGLLARGTVEVLDEARAHVEGRSVAAVRIALWVAAPDWVTLRQHPDFVAALRQAFAGAVEAPDAILRELIVLLERTIGDPVVDGASARGYRDASRPVRAGEVPAGETVAATAAALAAAEGAEQVARALGRAAVALEPVRGVGVSRVTVALDPADLALVRRDPRVRSAAAEAIETAARTPGHRAADVTFVVRVTAATAGGVASGAEAELAAVARRASWGVVPVERTEDVTTLAFVRDGAVMLVRIVGAAAVAQEGPQAVRVLTVSSGELADEAGALRALERLEELQRERGGTEGNG